MPTTARRSPATARTEAGLPPQPVAPGTTDADASSEGGNTAQSRPDGEAVAASDDMKTAVATSVLDPRAKTRLRDHGRTPQAAKADGCRSWPRSAKWRPAGEVRRSPAGRNAESLHAARRQIPRARRRRHQTGCRPPERDPTRAPAALARLSTNLHRRPPLAVAHRPPLTDAAPSANTTSSASECAEPCASGQRSRLPAESLVARAKRATIAGQPLKLMPHRLLTRVARAFTACARARRRSPFASESARARRVAARRSRARRRDGGSYSNRN